MSTAEMKYFLFQLIDRIQDENRLKAIIEAVQEENQDWWDLLTPEQQDAAKTGLQQAKNKQFIPEAEVRSRINNRSKLSEDV